MIHVGPVTLEGTHVRLRPMQADDVDALFRISRDPSLWKWNNRRMETLEDVRRYVADALARFEQRESLPFVVERAQAYQPIGSTRFGNIVPEHRRAEIGWTWIVPEHQRTAANTECKLLLLEFAFENWNCVRVELKTDALNTVSRSAMERIGAKHEGTLRQHMVTDTGRLRDTVFYSILDNEWPDVKRALQQRLREHSVRSG